ncbi:MAG: hypothetical protein FWE27_07445 [Defluviitaleaceae bacterium]|nr:hypothetical protein [Defluviitaleaceae bacterium]
MDKSKMMMIIIIALLVLLIGTVIGVGLYLVSVSADTRNFAEIEPEDTWMNIRPADLRTVSLGSMTANLAPNQNNRADDSIIVEVEVGLNASSGVDTRELDEFYGVFNRNIAIARAEVLNVFVTRTYDEMITLEGRLETAEIVKNRLQEEFQSNLIVTVSFPEWFVTSRGR